MKISTIAILLALTVSSSWLTDFAKAQEEARAQQKQILLNFSGSDWCAPCILMKREVFEKEAFQHFANENLILVRADFPRNKKNQLDPAQKTHNEKLAERYNPQGKFPLTLLLDAEGNVNQSWDGYQNETSEEFVSLLEKALPKK